MGRRQTQRSKSFTLTRDLIDRLQGVTEPDDISQILQSTISEFGYEQFVYARIPFAGEEALGEYINLDNLNEEWIEFYLDNELFADDYMAAYCTTNSAPLVWSDCYRAIDAGRWKQRYADTANISRDWGVLSGVTIPLPSVGRYTAGISLVADPNLSVAKQDARFRRNEDILVTLASVFHAHVDTRKITRDYFGVSPAELEVLKWSSEGMQAEEIAATLGKSTKTVHKQVVFAQRRLGAKTMPQAVAKAVLLGLID